MKWNLKTSPISKTCPIYIYIYMAVSILSLYLKKGAPSTTEPFPCKRQKAAAAIFQPKQLHNRTDLISFAYHVHISSRNFWVGTYFSGFGLGVCLFESQCSYSISYIAFQSNFLFHTLVLKCFFAQGVYTHTRIIYIYIYMNVYIYIYTYTFVFPIF